MENIQKNYNKFRWFFTSSEKLVIGGKSAEQNEELVKSIISKKENFVSMHTHSPGSPFSFIISKIKPTKKDIEEAAIFTASFSQAWKSGKKEAIVDIFSSKDISKNNLMKTGTFGIKKKNSSIKVKMKLWLEKQNNITRAIPEEVKNSIELTPGKIPKEKAVKKLSEFLKISKQEIESALPSGGFSFKVSE